MRHGEGEGRRERRGCEDVERGGEEGMKRHGERVEEE